MTHNRLERAFDRMCTRFRLTPSRWIPHLTADGVYEKGLRYSTGEDFAGALQPADGGGTAAPAAAPAHRGEEVFLPSFSLYNTFWLICHERRKKRNGVTADDRPLGRAGRWERTWSFLSDVDTGIFDTVRGTPVTLTTTPARRGIK